MQYNKEVLENKLVKFTVEVAVEDWQNAITEAYNKTKHKFSVEGFRKGKVPKRVIENMYGVGVFFEDALDIIIPKAYGEILDKEVDFYPVDRPDVEIIAISDTEMKFSATAPVKPDVKLGEYKGLTIAKVDATVTDEDVQAEIIKAQEKAGSKENVDNRPAQKFDSVIIDYSGSVDGVVFEGGTAEKQTLDLGSGMFIPGFEEQVEGMSIGEEKEIKVNFPADYGSADLAGKEAVFAIKLHEILAKKLPEINDEFVKDVSEFDTLEDYKADIKAKLEKENQTKADREMENALLDEIAQAAEVEIPDAMIENQIEDMIQEFEYRLQYQGMKIDDYYKYTNSSRDALKIQYNSIANKNVRMRLVMEAIIKAENIVVTDEELNEKIADFAKGANKTLEEYKPTMHPQQLTYVENEIVTNKLIAYLKENNKFA